MGVDHPKRRRAQRFDPRRNGWQRIQNPYELRDLLLGAVLGAGQYIAQVFTREMRTEHQQPREMEFSLGNGVEELGKSPREAGRRHTVLSWVSVLEATRDTRD